MNLRSMSLGLLVLAGCSGSVGAGASAASGSVGITSAGASGSSRGASSSGSTSAASVAGSSTSTTTGGSSATNGAGSTTGTSATSGSSAAGGPSSSSGSGSTGGGGQLTWTGALQLDQATYHPGDIVAGRATLGNVGGAPAVVQQALITARPPGGSHAGGPYDDFAPATGAATLAPSDTLVLDATFGLPAGAPVGTWEAYATYQDEQGSYHDGPSVFFDVTAPSDGGGSPSSSALPPKVVGGYFTTWSGSSLQTVVDNTNYNLVYVAFATGVSASSGSLQLQLPPGASSAADFKNQIAYANARGVKVLVSVGGYYDLGGSSSGYVLDSSAKVDDFMVSMRDLRSNWGFNGMDWDLEHGERPDVTGIVDASQRMKSEFGPDWIINAAPGVGLATWTGAGGVLETLGPNGWDAVGEQIYDLNLQPSDYQSEIESRMTALASQFGADKVILGNKYRQDSPSAPYEPTNYVPIATTLQALSDLRASGVNIRGSFVWTIQSDGDQSYDWSTNVGGDILSHP